MGLNWGGQAVNKTGKYTVYANGEISEDIPESEYISTDATAARASVETRTRSYRGEDVTDYTGQTQLSPFDFAELDTDGNNEISTGEWQARHLDGGLLNNISGGDGLVSREEWDSYLDKQTAAHARIDRSAGKNGNYTTDYPTEFAGQTSLNSEDFLNIDKSSDGSIDRTEWEAMKLDKALFEVISKGDGAISRDDWSQYLDKQLKAHASVPRHNTKNGNDTTDYAGQTKLTEADFHAIHIPLVPEWLGPTEGAEPAITKEEWDACGLDAGLFKKIAGSDNEITLTEWRKYLVSQKSPATPRPYYRPGW